MRVTDSERKQYIKQIRSLLVCDKNEQKKFLSDFNNNIDDFLQENPEADMDALQKSLGTPQEIADGFLSNASPKDIKKQMSLLRASIIGIVGVLIVVFAVYLSAFLISTYRDRNAHFEDTIIDHGIIYESGAENVTSTD